MSTTIDVTAAKAHVAKMDEIGQQERWTTVFNELCDDGFIRPVIVHPRRVTSVQKSDPPFDVGKYKTNPKLNVPFDGGAVIAHEGREIRVFESINMVFQMLGSMLVASDCYATTMYHAGIIFEKNELNYCLEFAQPTQLHDE